MGIQIISSLFVEILIRFFDFDRQLVICGLARANPRNKARKAQGNYAKHLLHAKLKRQKFLYFRTKGHIRIIQKNPAANATGKRLLVSGYRSQDKFHALSCVHLGWQSLDYLPDT